MNPGVYVGIATYDGKLQWQTVAGLVEFARFCGEKHLSLCVDVVPGDAFIGKARDTLAHRFLKHTDWQDFIFIDADVGFNLEGLKQLMRSDVDIVGGLYRCKTDKPQYPGLMWPDVTVHETDKRLILMQYMPTGFLRIKRRVFEKMREQWPEDYYYANSDPDDKQYAFFPSGRDGHAWRGEDIWFCMRAIECGFQVWACQDIELTHTGAKTWDAKWRVLRAVDEAAEKAA